MTLLKDNNYKDINIALLSLENDVRNRVGKFDEIITNLNRQVSEINAGGSGGGSGVDSGAGAEAIASLKADIENFRDEIDKTSTIADSALTAANSANTVANEASTVASGANVTANNALNKANEAKTNSNNAQTTANNAVTTANNAVTTANNAMPKSGGTFTGPITFPADQWERGKYVMNLQNSNVIGINSLYMQDPSDSEDEGIIWKKSDGGTETLRARDGKLTLGGKELAYKSELSAYRTNADEGYLCKFYELNSATGNSTNQATNVILLGKIPDPSSSSAPASPETPWDIDVDIYFTRGEGHMRKWCNVKAGFGYSNYWRKYGHIETFGVTHGSNYSDVFNLVTFKWGGEWYMGVRNTVDIDGGYSARVHDVTLWGRNPTTFSGTQLANALKVIPYKKNDGTVLNSEINGSISELPVDYAPTIETNGGLLIRKHNGTNLSGWGNEALTIGSSNGLNIGIDADDIQARNGTNASTLDLNYYGGKIRVNGSGKSDGGLVLKGHLNIPTSAPSNPEKGDIWLAL